MPIEALNKLYNYPPVSLTFQTFYKCNAGDVSIFKFKVLEEISLTTGQAILSYNAVSKSITYGNGNPLIEGFRNGDELTIEIFDSSATLISTQTRNITLVTSTQIVHDSTPITWYNSLSGEILKISIKWKSPSKVKRNGLELLLNFVPNSATGNEFSLIDGEATKLIFDLTTTVNGTVVSGTPVGLRSGQFFVAANIEDETDYTLNPHRRQYEVVIQFIQSGVYDDFYFNFSNCIKPFVKLNWQRTYGDPNNMSPYVITDQADTGFFDEAFNSGIINSALVQGISSLDYVNGTVTQIAVDFNSNKFYFGACYVPQDDAYYKSRIYTQSELGMIAPTQGNHLYPLTVASSYLNPSGAGYTITISNPVQVGTITTFDLTFTPNADFATFMEARQPGDRLFRLWIKAGNVNWLLFDDQLTAEPEQPSKLILINHDFVDHSENINDTNSTESGFIGNVEDDLAFIGKLAIPYNSTIDYVKTYVKAVNIVTGDEFVLQNNTFNFSSVPLVAGAYPINQSQEVFTILDTTNVKRYTDLVRDTSVDTASDYGIRLHCPIVYRWEYWLPQTNANAVFYPNEQTKNWVPFDSTTDWNIEFEINALINSQLHIFSKEIRINDYDSDPNVFQKINLIRDLDDSIVDIVIEGEMMRVVAYNVLADPTLAWDEPTVWGAITVEPFENAPRFMCSTVVPYDNNPLNPLTPLVGSYCELTFPSYNVAKLECYFDSTKINLANGVKFTAKIKGCSNTIAKLKADGTPKAKTDNTIKLKSEI